ncbi:processed acidic surface protein [Bacillus sp. JJ1764]|uniref:processed acidic surface protein n=1 Tax=Bacillus sp. JJ1764 TaxID=3122964 RepID=UPI002FFEA8DC
MWFKNIWRLTILSLLLFIHVPMALAAPPEKELTQYLASIGWSKQELQDYLDFYEITLDEFASVDELKEFLGTPINDENLQVLLKKYNLSKAELNDLLNHFGDSLADYKFIEDLDSSLEFYVNNDDYMGDIENELKEMGITEEESERFFEYLGQVEENNKFQLDQMEWLDSRIEPFLDVNDTTELTDKQIDELVDLLTDVMDLYQIQVKFSADKQNISLTELLKMKEPPKNLMITINTRTGEPLLDFNIPSYLFDNGEIINQGEEMIHLGDISNDFIDHLHDEKSNHFGEWYK